MLLLFVGAFSWTMMAQQQITITYTNNGSATIPDYSTGVQGQAWGGGGGGGGVYSGGFCQANAGGGGGGAYALKNYTGGVSLSLTVGAGGTRGANNANGFSGGTTTITASGYDTVTAGGGGGGTRHECAGFTNTDGMGGAGGIALGGDINTNGGDGYNYNANPASSGGGSPNGGAITGQPNNGNNAIEGKFPGGGGSGARDSYFPLRRQPGARGANGQVIVSFTLPVNTLSLTSGLCEGDDLVFSITNYQAHADITYTLMRGSTEIGTFTGSTYTLTNAELSASGSYTLVASYNFAEGHLQTGGSVSGETTTVTSTSNTVNVTVNPKPDITVASQSVCSGEPFSFAASSLLGTDIATVSWAAPTFNDVTGTPSVAETDQTALAGTLISSLTTDDAKAVYVLTPKSSVGCVGTSENFTVNVLAVPTITGPIDTALCSGESFILNREDIVGTTSHTEFTWTLTPNSDVSCITDGSAYTSSISASNIYSLYY